MLSELEFFWDSILTSYSTGDRIRIILNAKTLYFELTGKLDEDDEDFSSKMNCFDDWFIHQYKGDEQTKRICDLYVEENQVDQEIVKALEKVDFGLYLYIKTNRKKEIVLKDILNRKKIVLSPEQGEILFNKDEFFIGRVIEFRGKFYLMRGLCLLPQSLFGLLKKEAKKVFKKSSKEESEKFLFKIEALKTKYLRYRQIDPKKLFTESLMAK